MIEKTLYKREAKGGILVWNITKLNDGALRITHGLWGGKRTMEVIQPTKVRVDEYASRIKEKRKSGYKELEDLYDNAPEKLENGNLYHYLMMYLPKNNTTDNGFILPMLAKTLEDNKPFEKHTMLGQWKINGLRCIISAEKSDDLFQTTRFKYQSREGTEWNLSWMDELLLLKLPKSIIDLMLEENASLDGELYLPGYSVNEINSFVKNSSLPQHFKLQYWWYDLCIEGVSAMERYSLINGAIKNKYNRFSSKEEHLNNTEQLIILPSYEVSVIDEAVTLRDDFISLGFEGLILRNPLADYAFGKRNSSMFKYKKKYDGLFEVVDIKSDKRGLPIYILRNDINDELFECTINLPQDKQKQHLEIKELLKGKKGLVEYRERSGIKEVPFHAKLIKIFV